MGQKKDNHGRRLEVIYQGVPEEQVGTGSQFCICSIYRDIPEKSGLLCEPCRLALATRVGQGPGRSDSKASGTRPS